MMNRNRNSEGDPKFAKRDKEIQQYEALRVNTTALLSLLLFIITHSEALSHSPLFSAVHCQPPSHTPLSPAAKETATSWPIRLNFLPASQSEVRNT